MNDQQLKVMIVEDHPLLRLGLKIVLEQRHVSVIAEAENGEQALASFAHTKPDVILMDVGMPVMDGIEAARRIRDLDKEVKIIMLTSLDNEEHIYASLAAGVNGYCLKETQPDRLLTALKSVQNGDLWIDSSIAAKVLRNLLRTRSDGPDVTDQKDSTELSREELRVLHLIVEGVAVSEIASKLGKSEQQIKEIEFSIVERLAASDRTQSALAKVRRGGDKFQPKLEKLCGICHRKFDNVFECCPFDGANLEEIDELYGTTFADRYEIGTRLGAGGMSVVYKARHNLLGRTLALKLLDPLLTSDLQNARRFREEALASSLLSHINLISISDFGLSNIGEPYLAMDYVSGTTLSAIISDYGLVSVERALPIFIQICDGLAHAHSKGVIHRDLKPSNIMLVQDPKGGQEIVKIIDFGIAKVLSSPARAQNLTLHGEVLGSVGYMSPEQCKGLPMDERADIYSLGCTIYEALTGQLPFLGNSAFETMDLHVKQAPQSMLESAPACAIPAALDEIVMKALRKEKSERYQSMELMKEDLSKLLVASKNN